ncbi:MAG: type II toxin-antitoxin system VapC family toxin [Candidatus Njordarchaeota archaeon]
MAEYRIYLDTSAIVKRYIEEKGSDTIDKIYELAERGDAVLIASVWNIGEVIGVFTKRRSRGDLTKTDFQACISNFLLETLKLIKMNSFFFIPIFSRVLFDTIKLVLKYYIYEADALQVSTAKSARADIFLSADESLVNIVKKENISAYNIEKEEWP